MERLLGVVQELSRARNVAAVTAIVREAARSLTGADGATFVLRDGMQCFYVAENAIAPLWQGRRFPMETCVSGWVMFNREPAVIEDIYRDDRIPESVYRPTFVRSMVMVPIRREAPVGAIGNYWATLHRPTPEEVSVLQALADTTSVALENARLNGDLDLQLRTLQERDARLAAHHDKLEVFSRALAHDLREPLRTIRSFIGLIDGPDDAAEKGDYLRRVAAAAERMDTLIGAVAHYVNLGDASSFKKQPCSMEGALAAAVDNLTAAIRETATTIDAGDLPSLPADPLQMTQLWQNLLANAIHHGKPPVHIAIRAEATETAWLFSVADNGPGVPDEFRQVIFKPFKRLARGAEHSGLGLAACAKIVELHGGTIWCESEPGHGAAFFFTLPVSGDVADLAVATAARKPGAWQTGERLANVLLVDDLDEDVLLTRLMLFERPALHCNLHVAVDGRAALKHLEAAQRRGEPIDLLLLDINLPGLGGLELMDRMQQADWGRRTATIICSGSRDAVDRQRAQSLGAAGFLDKPAKFEDLEKVVSRIDNVSIHCDPERGRQLLVGKRSDSGQG